MKIHQSILIPFCALLLIFTTPLQAQPPGNSQGAELDLFKDFDYPELQVVPRASDRLAAEAQNEDETHLYSSWPLQISALATVMTGTTTKGHYSQASPSDDFKKDADNASLLATAVGSGWFLVVTTMSFQEPYRKALGNLKRMKVGDRRAELYRERMAEEVLENQSRLSNIIMYTSVATNLLTSLYAASYTDRDSKTYAYISSALAFLPILFPATAITTYQKHLEYKRKIYTPLTWLQWNSRQREWTPQMAMRIEF